MIQISIVQVLRKEGLDYEKIVLQNKAFLDSVDTEKEKKLEYIVYDNLESYKVLGFVKNIAGLKYFRKTFQNLKTSLLEAGLLTNGQKIIYLKSDDVLTLDNVQKIETTRPHILRKDLKKISELQKDNFKYDEFNLLIKENKTLWEKIKLYF